MTINNNITRFIGNTPLVKLNNVEGASCCSLYAKLEMFNPLSSVKDRAAFYMIKDAEEKGILKSGSVIIEPTSGNTGIALAYIGKLKGYKVILTMPETMSLERRKLLELLGAQLVLTPGPLGMKGAVAKAEELLKETPDAFMPNQFANSANARAHFETTGPELWTALEGKIDIFVAGVGTGGTITGAGEYFKSKNPSIKLVAVQPSASPVLTGGAPGPHKIQGIGPGFVPKLLKTELIDEIIDITDTEAFEGAKMLRMQEGIFCGISCGAAYKAAAKLAARAENKGKNIVVILPDTGERYLSMF